MTKLSNYFWHRQPAIVTALPLRIVDVGSLPFGEARYASLVADGLASAHGFDPQVDGGKCLGDGTRRRFYVTRFPGCSSLLEPDPDVINCFNGIGTFAGDNFEVVESHEVRTVQLDSLGTGADLLKLDTQGSELEILRHGRETLATASVIEIEVSFAPLYKAQPLFDDVSAFMRSHGFALHKLVDWMGKPVRPSHFPGEQQRGFSQLVSADAVFIRPFYDLRATNDRQLVASALILSDAYRSFDMAYHFLAEHDRRTGSRLGLSFADALKSAGPFERLLMNESQH